MVIFSCNTCPWVARWEDRYNPIANLAKQHEIGVIALNSNAAIRDQGESFEDMKQRAQKSNYHFYYALDQQSKIAEAFGATHTPHIFLFNGDMHLVYRGTIDDNARSAVDVEKPYLKNAIIELASGKEIRDKTSNHWAVPSSFQVRCKPGAIKTENQSHKTGKQIRKAEPL